MLMFISADSLKYATVILLSFCCDQSLTLNIPIMKRR